MEDCLKRVLLILFTPILFSLLAYAAIAKLAWPRLESAIREKITAASLENLDLKIEVSKIDVQIIPTRIDFQQIQITPVSQKIRNLFELLKIKNISARFDLFDLLSGRFEVSAIVIENPSSTINLQTILDDKSPSKALPLETVFEVLPKIPIKKIIVQNSDVNLLSVTPKLEVPLKKLTSVLDLNSKHLDLRLDLPASSFKYQDKEFKFPTVSAAVSLEQQKFTISNLLIQDKNIKLSGQATLLEPKFIAIRPRGELRIKVESDLAELFNELTSNFKLQIPTLQGKIKSSFDINLAGLDKFSGKGKVETQNVKVSSFNIGNAFLDGEFDKEGIRFSEISITHPAGSAQLEHSTLKLDQSLQFQSLVKIKSLDLQTLMQTIGLKEIPVELEVAANLPCKGSVLPFKLSCQGDASLANLSVRSEFKKDSFEIARIKAAKLNGQFSVDKEKVAYKSEIQMGESRGSSEGEVIFSEGFDIKYKASKLFIRDLTNLANLKLEGTATLDGETKGDSAGGVFTINLATQNFFFDDYSLGQVSSNIQYEKGHLLFQKIDGYLEKSRYGGDLDVNLKDSRISGKIDSIDLDLQDVSKVIDRIYRLPVAVEGKGKANFVLDGPLNFWKMNYKLDSNFQKGKVFTETFDQFKLNLSAKDGKINADQIFLKKNQSLTSMLGSISPGPIFDLHVKTQNYRLEESNLINLISTKIFGLLQAQADLTGTAKEPIFGLKVSIADTVLEDQEISNSNLEIRSTRDATSGTANIFGSKIQADFSFPSSSSYTPMHIRTKTTDFNFANLLAVLGGSNIGNEYESSISADIDLTSPNSKMQNASGLIKVKELSLKRGQLSLQNPDPMIVKFTNGKINLEKFRLLGPGCNIQISGDDFSLDKLQVNANVKTDLRLFQVFLPFLDDLGGPLELSSSLSGPYNKPQILGSGHLSGGLVKLKGFPHAIERLNIESVFSHSKIIISNLSGNLASGQLSGDGAININGINDIPTNIRLKLENVSMNVPEKVKSSGNAELLFSGNWFPFLLSGNYNVTSALVEKEFQDDGSGPTVSTKRNLFLPKILKQADFEPIQLDIMVKLDRNVLVKNSLMDGSVNGQLNVKGVPQAPVLLGKINIDKSSKLIVKDKTFEVISGQANFTDPTEINPDLFLSAQARVTEFDVNLIVQGPAKSPSLKWSSLPPLPEQDIISLLALGITSSRLDQNVQSKDQANQTGYEIGAAILSQNLSKQFKNKLGLEVQFGSTFDSTKNINVPKITLSRKLNRKLDAAVSVTRGAVNNNEVRLQYSIDQNFSAIGSWEGREATEGSGISTTTQESQSIFGIDLEFKREFK